MNYAQACARFEQLSRHAHGSQRLELRPDGIGGYQVTALGPAPAAFEGVVCDAIRRVPGNVWQHRRSDGWTHIRDRAPWHWDPGASEARRDR